MKLWILSCAAVVGLLLAPARSEASDPSAKGGQKGKQYFHLTMPHTEAECLAALDHLAAKDKKLLEKTDWGCMHGDHTGYVTVAAADEQAALAMVPEQERAKARAQHVGKFSQKDLAAIHKSMEAK